MTLEKARQLLATQASFGSGYNRNGARLILAEVAKEHGQAEVDRLIRELSLDSIFGIVAGTSFVQ
ncbi:MAG TPA: hypothetical protein VMV91_01310 [Rhodocyclaceae bacterium]|nr:hypothetical protein [Rhodocyclaceae bacterium]